MALDSGSTTLLDCGSALARKSNITVITLNSLPAAFTLSENKDPMLVLPRVRYGIKPTNARHDCERSLHGISADVMFVGA